MFTRDTRSMGRFWRPTLAIPGAIVTSSLAAGQWTRGKLRTAGMQPLMLPDGGSGFGYAMDPSDPKTWRRPVRWT